MQISGSNLECLGDIENLKDIFGQNDFPVSAQALDIVCEYYDGYRKDGKPSVSHPIFMANKAIQYFSELEGGADFDVLTASVLLHDVPEDYGLNEAEMAARLPDTEAGRRVAKLSCILSKTNKTKSEYRDGLASEDMAVLTKGIDGISNLTDIVNIPNHELSKKLKFMHYYVDYTEKLHRSLLNFLLEKGNPLAPLAQKVYSDLTEARQNVQEEIIRLAPGKHPSPSF